MWPKNKRAYCYTNYLTPTSVLNVSQILGLKKECLLYKLRDRNRKTFCSPTTLSTNVTMKTQNWLWFLRNPQTFIIYLRNIGDQDKSWAAPICCHKCATYLSQWLNGKDMRCHLLSLWFGGSQVITQLTATSV